jgi:tripeptide aminopeptidase
MRAYERLLKYVVVHTTSDEESESVPSTSIQFDLARLLEAEMKELGISDVSVDEHCYVTGRIPATKGCENAPKIWGIWKKPFVSCMQGRRSAFLR